MDTIYEKIAIRIYQINNERLIYKQKLMDEVEIKAIIKEEIDTALFGN